MITRLNSFRGKNRFSDSKRKELGEERGVIRGFFGFFGFFGFYFCFSDVNKVHT